MKNITNIEIFQSANGMIEFNTDFENETIWANLDQIAKLFGRDKSGISRHIKNIFKTGELEENSVVAKIATTASDGKIYQVDYYNLDMIISVGYKVNSIEATLFRQWATSVLKSYIQNGYVINSEKITNERFVSLESDLNILKSQMGQIKSLVQDNKIETKQGIFYDGQIYDSYSFVSDLIKTAKKEIILIDNYVDDSILTLFSKIPNIKVTIYTNTISKQLKLDFQKYSKQYDNIILKTFKNSHDRFLILDQKEIYHIGASLKDLGKKWFAFSKIDLDVKELIGKIDLSFKQK